MPGFAPSEEEAAALDPPFARMIAATERHVWELPRLTVREKVFLSVVADICHPTLGLPFEMHVKAGLATGMSTADIRALIRYVGFDTGYPAALAAIERLGGLERALGSSGLVAVDEPELVEGGSPALLPPGLAAMYHDVDEGFATFMLLQAGMHGDGSSGLSIREQSFASIMVDVLYQTLDETFRIHVDRALNLSVEEEDVRSVVRFAAQFGVTKAWRAFRALNTHLAEVRAPTA